MITDSKARLLRQPAILLGFLALAALVGSLQRNALVTLARGQLQLRAEAAASPDKGAACDSQLVIKTMSAANGALQIGRLLVAFVLGSAFVYAMGAHLPVPLRVAFFVVVVSLTLWPLVRSVP